MALGLGIYWLFTSPKPEVLPMPKSVSTPINDTSTKQAAKAVGYNYGPYWQKHYNRAIHCINLHLLDSLRYELDCLGSMPQGDNILLLNHAIHHNAIELVAELVKRNKSASGFPFQLQSYNGNFLEEYINLKTFRYIVAEGLYEFPETEDSTLSLVAAIKYKNTDLVNYWLINGCDSHLDSMVLYCRGECYDEFHSPLTMAISQCDTLLIRRFLGMGASIKPLHFGYAATSC
jgi:ankyrin repeat protein